MHKLKKEAKARKMSITVTHETLGDFFVRGKKTARLLDKKALIEPRRIISFEDVRDLVNFLTTKKLELLETVRKHPSSLSVLAKVLGRSRAAVDKDVQQLESVGIIKSEYVTNPGHGRHKVIMAVDKTPVKLQVQATI